MEEKNMPIYFSKPTDVTIWIPTLTRNDQIISKKRGKEKDDIMIVKGGGITIRNIFL